MPLVERPPKGKGLGACLAYVRVPRPRPARPSRIFADGSRKSNNEGKHFSRRAFSRNGRVDARRAPRRERRANTKPSFRKTKKPIFFTLPSPSSSLPLPPSSPRFVTPNAHEQVKAVGMALYVGADHVVWATSAGVLSGGDARKRAASASKSVAVGLVRREPRERGGADGRLDTSAGRDVRCETRQRRHRLGHRHRRSSFGRRREGARAHGRRRDERRAGVSRARAFEKTSLSKRRVARWESRCPRRTASRSRRFGRARRHENKNVSRKEKQKCADSTYTTKKPSVNASSSRASPNLHTSESVPCFRRSAFVVHTPLTGRRAHLDFKSALSARDAQHTTTHNTPEARPRAYDR